MDDPSDFEDRCQEILAASRPEDVFGVEDVVLPVTDLHDRLKGSYDRLVKIVAPSNFSDLEEISLADEASDKLRTLYTVAREKIARSQYGLFGYNHSRPLVSRFFDVGHNRYYLGMKISENAHSSTYQAYLEREGEHLGEVVVKVARDHDANHYFHREVRALDILHEKDVPQWKHLPLVLDRFEADGRMGLVLRKEDGLTLTEARKRRAQVKGVDQRHMVWMLDRALSCLGYVHRCGLVHGALCPDRLMINARLHNVFIVDWDVSVHNPAKTGERVEAEFESSNPYVSPEVRERGRIGPWSDVYSLGKVCIWLVGGDPATNFVPHSVEDEIKRFLLDMVKDEHSRRSADCWELYREQERIKDSLWPRKFLHFDVS